MRLSGFRSISASAVSGLVLVFAAGCTDQQSAPLSPTALPASSSTTTPVVFASGSHVTTWDPILPSTAYSPWSAPCTASPAVGPNDARWTNPHTAFVATAKHPWESHGQGNFNAPWINAWKVSTSDYPGVFDSDDSGGPGGHNWTKYSTKVSGNGGFVLQFLADNCSWIYVDDTLVGYQDHNWDTNGSGKYAVNLSGDHTLTFVIYDGGGAAGGKFRLETRESFVQNGGNAGSLPKPSDTTPPAITPSIAGTQGTNGWYTSDIEVSWNVADGESSVSSTSGCTVSTVSSDTPGASFTCKGSSAGGAGSKTVTVKRDATAPALAFSGNQGTYTVDETVAIGCSASDATSGLAASDCPEAKGDAYTFALGSNTRSATAKDLAGNSASVSTSFTVKVTAGSLCALTQRWVSKAGVAHSLCKQLENHAIPAYQNHLRAQTGKSITAAHAAILQRLSEAL